jgi:molybdopterin-binding protein
MRWWLDSPTSTVEIDIDGGPGPSREEVDRALDQLRALANAVEIRTVVVNGETVAGTRRGISHLEIEVRVRYEAARLRAQREIGPMQGVPARSLPRPVAVEGSQADRSRHWRVTTASRMLLRNQLNGTVISVSLGAVKAEVVVDIGGQHVVAAITKDSAKTLGLRAGGEVFAIIKATDVMIGTD